MTEKSFAGRDPSDSIRSRKFGFPPRAEKKPCHGHRNGRTCAGDAEFFGRGAAVQRRHPQLGRPFLCSSGIHRLLAVRRQIEFLDGNPGIPPHFPGMDVGPPQLRARRPAPPQKVVKRPSVGRKNRSGELFHFAFRGQLPFAAAVANPDGALMHARGGDQRVPPGSTAMPSSSVGPKVICSGFPSGKRCFQT